MKAEPLTAGTTLNQRGNTDGRSSGARPHGRRHASDTPPHGRSPDLSCIHNHSSLVSFHMSAAGTRKPPPGGRRGHKIKACSYRPVSSGGLALPCKKTKYGETRLGITQTRLRDTFVLVLEGASFHWTKVCVTHAFMRLRRGGGPRGSTATQTMPIRYSIPTRMSNMNWKFRGLDVWRLGYAARHPQRHKGPQRTQSTSRQGKER